METQNKPVEQKLTKPEEENVAIVPGPEQNDLMEQIFDVENFFKGTKIACCILFVFLLIMMFTLGDDLKIHFGVMILLDLSLLGIVIYYHPMMVSGENEEVEAINGKSEEKAKNIAQEETQKPKTE